MLVSLQVNPKTISPTLLLLLLLFEGGFGLLARDRNPSGGYFQCFSRNLAAQHVIRRAVSSLQNLQPIPGVYYPTSR